MTYLVLDLVFLAVLGAACYPALRRQRLAPIAATIAALCVLTVVFDSVIINLGFVTYDPAKNLGLRLGNAPVEDFAYALLAGIMVPALWCLFDRSRQRGEGR